MEVIIYIIFVVLCIFITLFIQKTFHLNSLKENKSITVSQLCHDFVESMAQKTLDTCIKLYGKHDDIDEFIQFVLKEIKIKIANSDLLDIEKDYWNHQRIEQSFLSLIVKTYRKTMK